MHNLRIDFGIAHGVASVEEDFQEGDQADVLMNQYNDEPDPLLPKNADESSIRRWNITNYLKNQGWKRPPHASSNSKA